MHYRYKGLSIFIQTIKLVKSSISGLFWLLSILAFIPRFRVFYGSAHYLLNIGLRIEICVREMAGIPSLTNWAAQYYSNYVGSRHCFSRFYKPEKFSQDFKSRYREFRLCVIEHCWNRATKYIPFSFRQAFSKRIHEGGPQVPTLPIRLSHIFFLSPNLPLLECSHVALRYSSWKGAYF